MKLSNFKIFETAKMFAHFPQYICAIVILAIQLIYSIPYQKLQLWGNGNTISQASHETLPLLHVACAEGNMKLVNTLIDCGVDVNETDQDGWPAIHYAVCAGYFECADKLISHGAKLKRYSNTVMNTYCQEIRNTIQTY